MTSFGLDISIAKSLNHWASIHVGLTDFFSKHLVYVVIIIGSLWSLSYTYRVIHQFTALGFIKRGIHDGLFLLTIPVGVATLISELVSQLYPRPRPFVAIPGIHLLTPHSADGGMPSHHAVFMVAIATCTFFYNRSLGLILGMLTLISGIARVSAGVHYPTDIIAGFGVGIGCVLATRYLLGLLREKVRSKREK